MGPLPRRFWRPVPWWRSTRRSTRPIRSRHFRSNRDQPTGVGRLLALHRDERLQKYQEHLPASYTTLYAIHRMSDEEIEAAVQQGVIHPKCFESRDPVVVKRVS